MQRAARPPAHLISTGIGGRSAHPDHRHLGAAQLVRAVTARSAGSAANYQPHQHADIAERILAAGEADMVIDGAAAARRPGMGAKGPRCAATRSTLHRLQQACLDHVFANKRASCLVPAPAETELNCLPTPPKRIAVVGAGLPGLATTVAAGRGHQVTLFDAATEIGGQFNLAKRLPGKEEFYETLRYFSRQLELTGVEQRLGARADAAALAGYDHVVLATGVVPRPAKFPGSDHPKVISYLDVLTGRVVAGARVAIVGAGGIGFDVAEYLVHETHGDEAGTPQLTRRAGAEWESTSTTPATVAASPPPDRNRPLAKSGCCSAPADRRPARQDHRLDPSIDPEGQGRADARGVEYLGLTTAACVRVAGEEITLPADHIVVCAGQPFKPLAAELVGGTATVHVIGGADVAVELDAKRAIDQASRLAAVLQEAAPKPSGRLERPQVPSTEGPAAWPKKKANRIRT
jgi:2,4-dienoyl-CoA reductase (NADPH2)